MRKVLSLLTVAALSMLLSACFSSEQPKFPASSAIAVLGKGGRYVVFEHAGNGKFQKQRVVMVTPLLDGSYELVGEKTVLPISFHTAGNGVIVGQAKPDDNKQAYGYLIVTRNGNEVLLHLPQCDKQDPAVLKAHGVILHDKFECSIDKVSDPAKLFAALVPGEPRTKLVPEN